MSYYFHMKNVNNFQIAKVHLPRVLLSIGVAHKYIAFSKKRAFQQNFELDVRHRKMGFDSCQIENQKKHFKNGNTCGANQHRILKFTIKCNSSTQGR